VEEIVGQVKKEAENVRKAMLKNAEIEAEKVWKEILAKAEEAKI